MATATQTGVKILRKLTIRQVVGDKAVLLAAAQMGRDKSNGTSKPVPILRVVGQVVDFAPGESDAGPYVKLKGQFEATNLLDGTIISDVAVAILPNMIADRVSAALLGGAKAVDFAVEIDVNYDETAATLYVFSARSLLKAQDSAPLTSIYAKLAIEGISLTAPLKLAQTPTLSAEDTKKQEAAQAA